MDTEPQTKRPKLSSLSQPDLTKERRPNPEFFNSETELPSAQCQDAKDLDAVDHLDCSGEKREAYYCANFKTVLKTVLSESPERHVISDSATRLVEQFMTLPGKANLNSHKLVAMLVSLATPFNLRDCRQ